jgi:hypothetical protein
VSFVASRSTILHHRVHHVNYYFNNTNSQQREQLKQKNANCAVNRFMFIFEKNEEKKTEAFRVSKTRCRKVASTKMSFEKQQREELRKTCLGGQQTRQAMWKVTEGEKSYLFHERVLRFDELRFFHSLIIIFLDGTF